MTSGYFFSQRPRASWRTLTMAAALTATCVALSGCIDPDEETQSLTPPSGPATTATGPAAPAVEVAPATPPAADATTGQDTGDTPQTTDVDPAGVSVSPRSARRDPIAAARRYAELEGNYTRKTFASHREQLRNLATGTLRTSLGYAPRMDRIATSSRTDILSVSAADGQRRGAQRTVFVIAQTTLGRSANVNYRTIRVRLRDTAKGWTVASWTEISGS